MAIIRYDHPFASREDADRFIASEYRRYPPGGYDTSLEAHPDGKTNGGWRVTGWRASTCD
ncbi:MAG: hypothetical protein ACK4FJ_18490 [Ferrovibrio sp.]|uniref:hypothetical protein n=1 Tax=Ferrovibrio sp. TaxID=1917215 RepID=UPI00391D7EFF